VGRGHGFDGWLPSHDVEALTVQRGALQIRSTGPDPSFASESSLGIEWRSRCVDLALAALAAVALTLLQAVVSASARSELRRGWQALYPQLPSALRRVSHG
jgi:hypothetical protein